MPFADVRKEFFDMGLVAGCHSLSVILFILLDLYGSVVDAAAPLQKIVFVFAGFNERSGFIFVAKDMRFFEEQGLDAQIVQVRNGPR